jgi:hypothetical protein
VCAIPAGHLALYSAAPAIVEPLPSIGCGVLLLAIGNSSIFVIYHHPIDDELILQTPRLLLHGAHCCAAHCCCTLLLHTIAAHARHF